MEGDRGDKKRLLPPPNLATDFEHSYEEEGDVVPTLSRIGSLGPPKSRFDIYLAQQNSVMSLASSQTSTDQAYVAGETGDRTRLSLRQKELTIQQKSKVEKGLSEQTVEQPTPAIYVIFKWFFSLLVFLVVLFSVSVSKISIIALGENLNSTAGETDERARIGNMRSFCMLMIVLLIPNVLSFLRAIWVTRRRSDLPFPHWKSVILGVFVSACESFGLCLFAFKILSMTRGAIGILLMDAVYIVPLTINMVRSFISARTNTKLKMWVFIFVFAFVFECAGVGLTVYMFIDKYKEIYSSNLSDFWHIPVAILLISVSWVPSIQKKLTEPSDKYLAEESPTTPHGSDPEQGASQSWAQPSSGYNSADTADFTEQQTTPMISKKETSQKSSAVWKHMMLLSIWKIIFILGFGILLHFFEHGATYKDFASEFRSAWNWDINDPAHQVQYFIINIVCSFVGYVAAFIACSTCMQAGGFALPLFVATPVAFIIVIIKESCRFAFFQDDKTCLSDYSYLSLLIPAAICLIVAQGLSVGWFVFRSGTIVLQKETKMFWLPTYNGVMLEQWLLLNVRNRQTDDALELARDKAKRTRVYICTTMYRENAEEMRQILQSINKVNIAQNQGDRHFESHIFFDGGVKDTDPSAFALQLVATVEQTLGVKATECTKLKTPYGMRLNWQLPTANRFGKHMPFSIHLKDNLKVKNKKRWSQIMYMSYVLDFLMEQAGDATDEETFILTTDADVLFTPESVEALLDLMTRDRSVGATCARTHPQGSGALVWYQIFEYAIGHWFQKAAEHVLGSVLCAPGCFSVYRCKAVRDVVSTYATGVDAAFDFLIKDMGEDRWLCTLMVQSGWRIEYCAASQCRTFCPEEFDEFYKQRRRWVASTIANLMLIVKEWKKITMFNHQVSTMFLVYQGLLLFSTLIGPSTVILIVAGGLTYGWGMSSVAGIILQIVICVIFAMLCLFTSQETQLKAAKFFTFLYAVVMTAVVVGTAEQIVEDIEKRGGGSVATTISPTNPPTKPPTTPALLMDGAEHIAAAAYRALGESQNTDMGKLPISVTTIYLACLSSLFLVTGLLHPPEFFCLLHGVWYLLCLPSGYLILNIYSVCNITDRSWGTREEKQVSSVKADPWYIQARNVMETIFFCCKRDDGTRGGPAGGDDRRRSNISAIAEEGEMGDYSEVQYMKRAPSKRYPSTRPVTAAADQNEMDEEEDYQEYSPDTVLTVEEWIPKGFKEQYVRLFKHHGFEDTRLISGMIDRELKDIGVKGKGHVQYLSEQIKLLPIYEIETEVPGNAEQWLDKIGLGMYKSHFRNNHIMTSKDMEVLKSMSRKEIEKELCITKAGHIKRLMYAIGRLRNPTESEKLALEVKKSLDRATSSKLKNTNIEEHYFWECLKKECLLPSSKVFGLEEELKGKLGELRNSWLMIFAVTNTLWLILITTLASKSRLTVLGANPLGLSFLFIFGFIFIIQFFAMWVHRVITLTHFLARAPYRFGRNYNSSWSFTDENIGGTTVEDSSDFEAIMRVNEAEKQAKARLKAGYKGKNRDGGNTERSQLAATGQGVRPRQTYQTAARTPNLVA